MTDEHPPAPVLPTENPGADSTAADSGAERTSQPWISRLAAVTCIAIFLGLSAQNKFDSWEVLSRWGYFSAAAIWDGAYWALVSSVFVHFAIWHVAFNVYWLWVLGSRLERVIGSLRFLGFFVLSAIISSSLQLAVSDDTGIGASGVVYAIFGFMWPIRHRFPQFEKVLDQRTVNLFVVWLIGCVAATFFEIWEVGNAAHISGLLFGVATASYFVAGYKPRLAFTGLIALIVSAIIPLFYCPWSVTWLSSKAYRAHSARRYNEAIALYTRIIRADPNNAWAYANRSAIYQVLGNSEQAQADNEKARTLDPSFAGGSSTDAHEAKRNVWNQAAWKACEQRQYAEAERLYNLAIREVDDSRPQDNTFAQSLHGLATVCFKTGKYDEADKLYNRTLAIFETNLGPEHDAVGATLTGLANLYADQGKHLEAETHYRRALAIFEKALGAEHSYTASALVGLAILYENQGKYVAAEPLYKQAQTIYEQRFGPEHDDVGRVLNNLANLYLAQGNHTEAHTHYSRALAIYEQRFGLEHDLNTYALHGLGHLFAAQGRLDEANHLYERCLALRERALGQDHPDVAASLGSLAEIHQENGDYAEAEALITRALNIRLNSLGPNHRSVATILGSLAVLHAIQGRDSESDDAFERSQEIKRNQRGTADVDEARRLIERANEFLEQAKYHEAASLYWTSLYLYEIALGPDDPMVAQLYENLADVHRQMQKTSEATYYARRAKQIRDSAAGSK